MPRTALVTGASAGIGERFAHRLAEAGYDLILTARREDRLNALAQTLSERFAARCTVIPTDLAEPAHVQALLDTLDRDDLQVDFLVNNAGFAARTSLVASDWATLQREIQVMVSAPTELMIRLGQRMVERGYGNIVNVASLAAFAPPPSGMLYTGIKRYLLDVSQSADMEFRRSGVRVTALCPGFTYTEFHDVQGTREQVSRLPGIFWQDADAVARIGLQAALAGKAVCVPGRFNRVLAAVCDALPAFARYQLGRRGRIY
ncbi:SDR family NAD(P)-dependent oxidoreductase [Marinobacter sp. JSM 1782161]|uniref:SDR family NAD(P)-dependent oxidoreductase n=1 Tax=Marinobacter sp. JSM 1782161 TaxID=2685906 RepID=UPI001403B6CA|nr:SDR family NAD(P)-dependent oxidoreductase [Marinobacter sp. JSM 1782161]